METQDSFISELLKCVQDNPGITGVETQKRFRPERTESTISTTLSRLQRMKLIENRGPGGPHSVWYPVEVEPVELEFVDTARWLIGELKRLPLQARVDFLARYLQEFCSDDVEEA